MMLIDSYAMWFAIDYRSARKRPTLAEQWLDDPEMPAALKQLMQAIVSQGPSLYRVDADRSADRGEVDRDTDRGERAERRERERAERRERTQRERERREEGERGERGEDKVDLEAMRTALLAAVAAGEITEDQAEERMADLRRHLIGQIEAALQADKITREEAREKVEAIHAMTRLGDDEDPRRRR
ncbi:hypothetical protein OT109_12355 [Phycisphaeraceae bacterium D3-23]